MAQPIARSIRRLSLIRRYCTSLTNGLQNNNMVSSVSSCHRTLMVTAAKLKTGTVTVTFIKRNGEPVTVSGKENSSLLDMAVDNDLDLQGFGICEGTVACSTCQVILKQEDYDRLPNTPGDDETDMLDLIVDLTPTSRLGCQVFITKELSGITVKLPSKVVDARTQ